MMPRLDRTARIDDDQSPTPDEEGRPRLVDREPVALAGAVQSVLVALLAVLTGFDVVSISDEQMGLVLALYAAIVVAVQAAARAKAWSPASVAPLLRRRP